jgi:hypothetical protein
MIATPGGIFGPSTATRVRSWRAARRRSPPPHKGVMGAPISTTGPRSFPAFYQCTRKSASTVAAPEIIAAMMATDGTALFGSSRLTSDARKIAATGNAITK